MITVLCGKVAAGKTALASRMQAEGAVVLSCDEMMLTLFDGCLGAAHDRTAMKCLHYLFSVAAQLAEKGLDAVIDYGFWLHAERDAARAYFAERSLPCRVLLVETAEDKRLSRLARRNDALRSAEGRVYLIEGSLLGRMDAKFEAPAPDEHIEHFDNTEDFI